jgi:UDP-2,4-diacetamido-2,4,6-trideoxy-beta-L-altropyranose hydrolase
MLKLRNAQFSDSEFLYKLRFSTEVIESSITKEVPTLEAHNDWFQKKITDPNTHILIVEKSDKCIGYLRFDIQQNEAEVSVAIIREERGKGQGDIFLKLGEEWLKQNTDVHKLTARVIQSNNQSHRLFIRNNFTPNFTTYNKVIL